jgi:hypothetical protein
VAAGAVTLGAFLPWGAFVVLQGLPNDVAAGLAAGAPTVLEGASRLPAAAWAVGRELVWLPRWGLLALVCVAVLVWCRPRDRGLVVASLAGVLLFLAVYVVTPRDFAWHVEGSVDRVVTAPLGLLALAAATAARGGGGLVADDVPEGFSDGFSGGFSDPAAATADRSPPPAREGSGGR